MISEREKFLMVEAMKAIQNYSSLEEWLNVVIDDHGHTVEQHLCHDADRYAEAKNRKSES